MASTRKLPSGRHQGRYRDATGQQHTETFDLRRQAKAWAEAEEAKVRAGTWIDPHAGGVTIAELWARFGTRALSRAGGLRDQSHWRCHVGPYWSKWPVGKVSQPDVTAWILTMQRDGVGAPTIEGAVGVLRSLLDAATKTKPKMIEVNPAADVTVPPRPARLYRILQIDEDAELFAALDRAAPGRSDGAFFAKLLLYLGLRWEEAAALTRDHVDLHTRLVHVRQVLERDGTIRAHPKSKAGVREVGRVGDHFWPELRVRSLATAPGELLVTTPEGLPLDYSRWYARVWRRALEGRPAYPGRQGHPPRPAVAGAGLVGRQPTPHELRHTCWTRAAEGGMPVHEIMRMAGHSTLGAVERYLHAGAGRFDRFEQVSNPNNSNAPERKRRTS